MFGESSSSLLWKHNKQQKLFIAKYQRLCEEAIESDMFLSSLLFKEFIVVRNSEEKNKYRQKKL